MKAFLTALLILSVFFGILFCPPVAEAPCAYAEASELAPYGGKVYHIFFHSLILYPDLAFKSDTAAGYDNWMTTRDEFKKILQRLYDSGFVLTDIEYIREATAKKRLPMLPKGKKPLIISVDDVNYYEYMKGDGFADKLVVDKKGRVAASVITPEGKRITDYEGDVMPIIDGFAAKHPDFSFRGAKGIVAVTGFQGVFGYRITTLKGEPQKEAAERAREVANVLKKTGWRIACHSYSHTNTFRDGSITLEKLTSDTAKWEKLIAPVTGRTNIFIPPFGTQLPANDARFLYLVRQGYNIYCPVYKNMRSFQAGNCFISERLNFDGLTIRDYPSRIALNFFDPRGIADANRPKHS